MRPLSTPVIGMLSGMAFMLGLYVPALLALWGLTGGEADPITAAIQSDYADLVAFTVLKFLLFHLLTGGMLGLAAALLVKLAIAPRWKGRPGGRQFLVSLGACLVLFLYVNARFMVKKPMFYDALLNAQGGMARWIQNTLTARCSPVGIDIAFALFVILLILVRRGIPFRRIRTVSAGGCAAGLLLILGLTAAPVQTKPPARAAGSPNILLLSFDSLRPDHLSCYGYQRKTSPHIDEVAGRGVRFDEAHVPIARTLPSWASLFTSTYPHTHGFRHMFPARERRKIHLPLLPRMLSEAGYRSVVISDYAGECFDMVDMGFDVVDVPPTTSVSLVIEREFMLRAPYLATFLDNRLGHRLLPLLGFQMINADPFRMADRIIDRMEGIHAEGRPFFITAFFSSTHLPYSAPYPYYKKYTDPDYKGIHKYGFGIKDIREIAEAMKRPPEKDRRQILDLYDGAVAATDQAVGGILEALEETGLAGNTIILITADHGESIYDHGNLLEHGERFIGCEAANQCPLILFDPTREVPVRRVEMPVSTLDIMPTLLARLSLPLPPEVRGRDMTPLLRGSELPSRPLFAETGLWLAGTPDAWKGSDLAYPSILFSLDADPLDRTLHLRPEFEQRAVTAKHRMIRTADFKLVYVPTPEGAEFHLFDVKNDPGDANNLHGRPGYEEIGETLKSRLFEWMLAAPGTGLNGRLHPVPKYTFYE
jgi:arylsulfatase A-like enzyme